MSLLLQLEDSALGAWIRESEWGYPIVLICHTVGMACLVGGTFAFAVRILFATTATPLAWFATAFRIAWGGFAINLVSGLILFSGAPQRFVSNPAFQVKLATLAAGALSLWVLARRVERDESAGAPASPATRTLAGASILFWIGAISAGRLIAYIR